LAHLTLCFVLMLVALLIRMNIVVHSMVYRDVLLL